jgi:hypothetical protein
MTRDEEIAKLTAQLADERFVECAPQAAKDRVAARLGKLLQAVAVNTGATTPDPNYVPDKHLGGTRWAKDYITEYGNGRIVVVYPINGKNEEIGDQPSMKRAIEVVMLLEFLDPLEWMREGTNRAYLSSLDGRL